MAELKTRKPTGRVAWPLILVEGEDKAGKTFASLQLSASPRVGQTFVLDTGDGTVDEYARLGPYLVLEHDGTWTSMIEQVKAAAAVPSDPERPNVIVVDSGTHEWDLLKDWASARARRSKKNRELLAKDPDAEVDVTSNYWNDAKDRWADLLLALKLFPGIAIITATGREVSKFENGVPVANQTMWSIEAEKTTTSWVSAWVRMKRPHQATLIAVRSLDIEVPAEGIRLPEEGVLDHLVFDILGAGGFAASSAVQTQLGTSIPRAKAQVLAAVKGTGLSDDEAKAEAARLWSVYGLPSGQGEVADSALAYLLNDIKDGSTPPPADSDPEPAADVEPEPPQDPPEPPQPPAEAPEPPEPTPEPEPAQEPPTVDGKPVPVDWANLTPDQVAVFIAKGGKKDLVPVLTLRGLPTSGRLDEMRDRLTKDLAALFEAPFEPGPEPVPEPPAESEGDAPEEATPESQGDAAPAVPAGWVEKVCFCGEPVAYEPGNFTQTIRHVDPVLDADHKADEAF